MHRRLALIGVALVTVLVGPVHADVLVVGDRAVELDVAVDRAGKPFKLAGLRGRWFLLTVGAEWCGPCKKELPIWDRLAGELSGQLTFVAVSLDDDIEDGKRFHTKLGLSHMLLAYLPQEKSSVAGSYGAATMPSTFIIDPKGVVRYVRAGFDKANPDGEYAAMKATIARLVGPAAPPKPVPPKPPKPDVKPEPKPDVKPEPKPDVKPEPKPDVKPDPPKPDLALKPDRTPTPVPDHQPDPKPTGSRDPQPEPVRPFSRGFALDVGLGAGLVRDGGVAIARGGAGVWLFPRVVAGLRFGVAEASGDPKRVSIGLVTFGADVDVWRGFVGAGMGPAVVDNRGALAIDVRAGWYVSHKDAHVLSLSLEGTGMIGDAGVSMITLVIGYRHR